MEERKSLLKSSDLEHDEVVFYTEEEIPKSIDVDDFIVFDSLENPQYVGFEDDIGISSPISEELPIVDILPTPKISNSKVQNKHPQKRWLQKDVTINTMESEFKVVMWVQSDTEYYSEGAEYENVETEIDSETTPSMEIKEEPLPSLSKPKLELTHQSNQGCLASIRCTMKSCRMFFTDVSQLREHLKKRHDPKVKGLPTKLGYRCTFKTCKKIFKDLSSLRKHLNTHGPRTKVCAECGKAFIDNSKLNRHLVVHTGEKPFQCTFAGCEKRFSLDFNLRTHVRIHTGYKPYVCNFVGCSKRFAQSTNLKSHQMTHLKQKPDQDVKNAI